MLGIIFFMTFLFCLTSCNNLGSNSTTVTNIDLLPGAHKDLKQNDTTQHEIIQTGCSFDNPDTSLLGIKLRNPKSAISVLSMTKLEGDTTYHFSSSGKT